jgi:hypothetical protein
LHNLILEDVYYAYLTYLCKRCIIKRKDNGTLKIERRLKNGPKTGGNMEILKRLFSGIYNELASIDYPKLIVWNGLIAASVAIWVFLTPLAIIMVAISIVWFFFETRQPSEKPPCDRPECANCTSCQCEGPKQCHRHDCHTEKVSDENSENCIGCGYRHDHIH